MKTASEIVDRALSLIDETPTTFATAATTEMSIREQALEILPEVCRDLIKSLPWALKIYLAVPYVLEPDTLYAGEDQSGYFKQKVTYKAPPDFLELVSIRLTVWTKTVTEYIYVDDINYAKQNNQFTRAGKNNPVVALNNTTHGSDVRIECFSIHNGDENKISIFEYISFNNVPDDVGNAWPDEVFDEITKALAAELHVIKGRINEATIKGEEVTNAIEKNQ